MTNVPAEEGGCDDVKSLFTNPLAREEPAKPAKQSAPSRTNSPQTPAILTMEAMWVFARCFHMSWLTKLVQVWNNKKSHGIGKTTSSFFFYEAVASTAKHFAELYVPNAYFSQNGMPKLLLWNGHCPRQIYDSLHNRDPDFVMPNAGARAMLESMESQFPNADDFVMMVCAYEFALTGISHTKKAGKAGKPAGGNDAVGPAVAGVVSVGNSSAAVGTQVMTCTAPQPPQPPQPMFRQPQPPQFVATPEPAHLSRAILSMTARRQAIDVLPCRTPPAQVVTIPTLFSAQPQPQPQPRLQLQPQSTPSDGIIRVAARVQSRPPSPIYAERDQSPATPPPPAAAPAGTQTTPGWTPLKLLPPAVDEPRKRTSDEAEKDGERASKRSKGEASDEDTDVLSQGEEPDLQREEEKEKKKKKKKEENKENQPQPQRQSEEKRTRGKRKQITRFGESESDSELEDKDDESFKETKTKAKPRTRRAKRVR
jgi:hypothetical protein